MNYFLDAEGKGQISNIGKTKFFPTKKYSKLFLSLIFKYHNGIWSIFPSATWLAILGKSVWFWSKDDIEHSWAGNHYNRMYFSGTSRLLFRPLQDRTG